MFVNESLQNHLESASTINSESKIVAEWNMNLPSNFKYIGNYRYRPAERFQLTAQEQSIYSSQNNSFDPSDTGNFYTDATYADTVIDGGYTDDDVPTTFVSRRKKEEMLYSLEDCLGRFRPRSGINKIRYFANKYVHHTNSSLASRPRYYMGHRDDNFKYWTSYRTENNVERGIANKTARGANYIDDASPFVVYDSPVPANRIVVKMQTNVGSVDLGTFSNSSGSISDPLFGDENKTTPVEWSIQYLKDNVWVEAAGFNANTTRRNGSAIVGSDGYVELQYGVIIPNQYVDIFTFMGEISSATQLPDVGSPGESYYVKPYGQNIGTFYIWLDTTGAFEQFTPTFGWQLVDSEELSDTINFVTELVDPPTYYDQYSGKQEYTEFQYISGLRVVVDTMNKYDSTFDLIEMSPRLVADLTGRTLSFNITKSASDLGASGLPVGQLLAATGSLSIFDYDLAFSKVNTNSIVKDFLTQNLQVKVYDVIKNVEGYNYYVPLKTMYVDGMPETSISDRSLEVTLRDLYFYFEGISAPELMIPNTSLSYAIATMLDYAGFSNYTIKTIEGTPEPIIPYFFVDSNETLAQVLEKLAVSTQSAMFFDEYNNFVVMTKEYLMASEEDRPVDLSLYGSSDASKQGVYSNLPEGTKANIIEISAKDNVVFNDGLVRYTSRYIEKSSRDRSQQFRLARDKNWVYTPSQLWEVTSEEKVTSSNEDSKNQSGYTLGAFPINSDLTDVEPYVKNNRIYNNTIDIGESVYWMSRYNGYLYANAEIIKFDAVEYNIPGLIDSESGNGNVWITSTREYQNYFSKVPFNGKIYPTGLVRIYTEPEYEVVDGRTRLKAGTISKNGRGQFGTEIAYHSAGLNPYWYDNANVRGCEMESSHIFGVDDPEDIRASISGINLVTGAAGVNNAVGVSTSRNGIIKNFFASNFPKDVDTDKLYTTQVGTLQSSALVMTGGTFASTQNPLNYLSYVYKPLNNSYKHFGTRVRLIGKVENNETQSQTPYGSMSVYAGVSGSSAGITCMVNPETNNGYYMEIIALDAIDTSELASSDSMFNVVFYKIMKDDDTGKAIPVMLWGGISNIVVDSGDFVGQYRMVGEENPSVYDLAVEYEDIGSFRRFYLYMNNKLIKVVDDESPLPVYNNMGVFVRGSAKAMFENIYAVGFKYSENASRALDLPSKNAFNDGEVSVSEAFRKYAVSGIVQSTALSGISPADEPKYNLYFEEFGTIMREAAYFNVRYDKAYPALYARLTPTFNRIKSYVVSGFMAGAYGAEFLVFNATDTTITLDENSGNYLQIQGITFTQKSDNQLTMDDYYSNRGDLSDPVTVNGEVTISPLTVKEEFNKVKNSRSKYGRREFVLEGAYIQSEDDAYAMMDWVVSKLSSPRLAVGAKVFANSTIQLGDIVSVDYRDNSDLDMFIDSSKRFVVYSISYTRTPSGPDMTVYLSEVV